MIQSHQRQYEQSIHQHLQLVENGSVGGGSSVFSQLHANVRSWQEHMQVVFEESADRPVFNFEAYSTRLLSIMSAELEGTAMIDPVIDFADLVKGQPRWEVCRRFVT